MVWNFTKNNNIKGQRYLQYLNVRNVLLKSFKQNIRQPKKNSEFKFPDTIEALEEGFRKTLINSNNKDETYLFLQFCRSIFKSILLGERNFNSIFSKQMKRLDQNNHSHAIHDKIKENIKREFQSDITNCREVDQPLIEKLLLISRKWYSPFTEYLQKIHKYQWRKSKTSSTLITPDAMERKLKRHLITNTDKYIPGFKYLFQNDWQVIDNQSQYGQGDLIFASDYGVLLVVEVKYLTPIQSKTKRKGRNMRRNLVKEQAEKYKFKAMEKFLNMNVAVIGAYFINEIDWNEGIEKETLVFSGEIDEMIAKAVKKLENDSELQRDEGKIFFFFFSSNL